MASSEVVQTQQTVAQTEVILRLTHREAGFINALMQNPIGCSPAEEDPLVAEMRRSIWSATNVRLVRSPFQRT